MRPFATLAAVVLGLSLCTSIASADTAAFTFPSPGPFGAGYYTPQTIGDVFTVSANLSVTALGVVDYLGDGLGESHVVGIFKSDGTLLGSATVVAGTTDPLIDGFRYVSISPLTLSAGQSYEVAAYFPTAADAVGYPGVGSVTPGSGIGLPTYPARYDISSPALTFPTGTALSSTSFYQSADFRYTVQTVPEPAFYQLGALLALGGLGLVRMRKRA